VKEPTPVPSDRDRIISLTTDWVDRGEGINIPASYSLKMGDYTTTLTGTTNEVNNYFLAGSYHINIWNTADHISIVGNTATADYSNELGWFFTGSQDVTIEKGTDHAFTVSMQQQVRQLTLVLEVTGSAKDKITAADATLSGVANTINIDNGTLTGTVVRVEPMFIQQTDGKYYASIRLLGITGNTQVLTVRLHFANGAPSSIIMISDLSDSLAAFNTDKKTPLTLSSTAVVTPTEAGLTATIEDWTNHTGNVIAD
jgi:hypothetical protein